MLLESLPSARAVAQRVADRIGITVSAKPNAVLLLPAGTTPIELYAELIRRTRAGALDLSCARLFQLDELLGVPPGDPRSFQAFFHEHLLEPLGDRLHFHALDGACPDPEAEIQRHRDELMALGGPDLVLLGLGKNGHVAFNEPGSGSEEIGRAVDLGESTLAGLRTDFPEGAPRRGLTLGLAEILAGRSVGLLVTGSSKAAVLARVLSSEPTPALPASFLSAHPDVTVFADAAALRNVEVEGA